MCIEDLLVVLCFSLLPVVKLKETLGWQQTVVVSLLQNWGEKLVANENTSRYVAGAAAAEACRGRTALGKSGRHQEFNPTRGYPGQDILFHSC